MRFEEDGREVHDGEGEFAPGWKVEVTGGSLPPANVSSGDGVTRAQQSSSLSSIATLVSEWSSSVWSRILGPLSANPLFTPDVQMHSLFLTTFENDG